MQNIGTLSFDFCKHVWGGFPKLILVCALVQYPLPVSIRCKKPAEAVDINRIFICQQTSLVVEAADAVRLILQGGACALNVDRRAVGFGAEQAAVLGQVIFCTEWTVLYQLQVFLYLLDFSKMKQIIGKD